MEERGPDSKQSWLVVLAICVIKFMMFGPLEIPGMFMVYTMYRFGTTREAASLPYTLVYTIRNGSGPIIAYIGNVIGLRRTTLIGCVMSSIAIGACFFAESVMTVTILWGIVFGFGFAFEGLFLNSITMEHFKKDVSKALGVTNAGAVVGVCCFAPYLDFLVDKFGLSGAFLLLAGATLHTLPAAFFMLLNKPFKRPKTYTNGTMSSSEVDNKITEKTNYQKTNEEFSDTSNCNDSTLTAHLNGLDTQQNGENDNAIYSSKIFNRSELQVKTISYKVYCTEALEIVDWNTPEHSIKSPLNSNYNEQKYNYHVSSDCRKYTSVCNRNNPMETHLKNTNETEKVADKLQTNKLMKTLFTHPIFWLVLICNGVHYFTVPAFFTLLVDYAIDVGIDPEYSKYIVIYSTSAEFIGCLVLGWLADLKLVSSNGFAIILFLCESMALIFIPWAQNIIFLALLVLVFQWSQTGITLIYPSVVSDSLEKEIQASALASMFILAAPLDLAISPLIGYFRDKKGSYAGVYLTLALAAFIGSLSQMCILKCVNRKKTVNQNLTKNP